MKTRSVKKYLFLTLIAVLCAACVAVGCLFIGGTPSVGAFTQEHDAAFGSDHSGPAGGTVTPKQLTEAGGKLSDGAYYLTSDITLTADITIAEGDTVDLCLNGYKLTGTGKGPVITVEKNATFNLHDCDSSDGSHSYNVNKHGKYEFADGGSNPLSGGVITGGTGKVDGDNTYGGGIFLDGTGAVFNMYGGAIAGNMAKRDISETGYSKDDATYGGGVYVGGGKTFNMYGGTIEGNTAGSSSGTNDETGGYNNDHDRGGGVAVNGTFNMYGGTIKNNAADDGAGIYVDGSGFTMYNAEVSNNFARHNGGGIYINDGTAVIGETDANGNTIRIENNRANSFAGGIYVNRETSELQLKSGFVIGNSAMAGGGIYVHSNAQNSGSLVLGGDNCSVTIMSNSAIYYPDRPTEATNGYGGGVFMRNAGVESNIDMSGTITITENNSKPDGRENADSDNLYLEKGISINKHTTAVDNVDGSPDSNLKINTNSQIGITLAARGDNYFKEDTFIVNGFGSDVTKEQLEKIFSSDVGGDLNVVISDNGAITVGSFNYSIPVDSTYAEARNNYTVAIQGTTPPGAQSGTTYDSGTFKIESRTEIITFTVTAPQGDDYLSVIINGGTGRNLNENEDVPPTAYIYNFATFSADYDGGIFAYTQGDNTVSVTIPYTLYASSLVSAEDEADKGIHIAYIGAEASVTKDDTTTYYYTIEQAFGAAVSGTTITLLKNADTANTLEVISDVTLDLSGHALSMASGATGSVISVVSGFDFTLKDSQCTDKKHTNHTHTITVGEDTVSISGGLITGGSAERGGGIYTDGGNVTMSGGTIACNTASRDGGGIYVSNGSFTMSGGTISNNTASQNGGGVYVDGGTFNMSDTAKISANSAAEGGGVYVDGGTFTMTGGEISNNTATGREGGGVYVYSSGTFNMQAAADGTTPTISGNSATNNGGGVYANYGTFNMSGGTISNNICLSWHIHHVRRSRNYKQHLKLLRRRCVCLQHRIHHAG